MKTKQRTQQSRTSLSIVSLLFAIGASLVTPIVNAKAPTEQAARFDYVKTSANAAAGGVFAKAKCCSITEWKITTPEGDAVELTVIDPPGKGKRPMVLWLHREGQEVKRAGFQQEAEALAAQGIASLLVELPFKQPYVHRANNNLGDAEVIRLAVVNARRALDWAATRPEFDMSKVAVVGHRFGAWAAVLLTSVDARIDGAILMSPPGKPSGWLQVTEQPKAKAFRESFAKESWGEYLNSIEPLDPEKWIGFAAPAKVFYQFGSSDAWVQTLEQVDLFRATSQPKSRQMYDSDEMLNDEAKKDRLNWLRTTLRGK
jgi:pimeloyl-ACP methyl ester carboxylesterase